MSVQYMQIVRNDIITSVSETIRKPPLVKAQIALRKHKIKYGENDFQYGGWNSYILQCGTIATLISPSDCTLQSDTWFWNDLSLNSPGGNAAGGSGMTCHWIHPNVCHIGILLLVSISTISPQSTCHSALVWEILSKSDHPRQKKMTSCRFSFWILGGQ